jgi:hypothetical protein
MLGATHAALVAALALGQPAAPAPAAVAPPAETTPAPARADLSVVDLPPRLSPKERKANRGLLVGGAVMFTVFYGVVSGLAAAELDDTRRAEDTPAIRDRRRIAYLSLVPIAGPLVAAPLADSKGDKAAFVGFALFQSLGVAMISIAAVNLARDHRRRRIDASLAAAVTPHGGGFTLRGRF